MSEAALADYPDEILLRSAADAVLPRGLSTEVAAGREAYAALAGDWRRLSEAQPGVAFFQRLDLLAVWERHFQESGSLATLVVRRDGHVVMIWPLAIERRFFVRVACGAGAPIGQ
jgi:CelD/BcsL family acetyltransferase involved in cellulose biosynthesis